MSSNLSVETFFHEGTNTATHVAWCPDTSRAAIIDSVLDFCHKSGRTDVSSAQEIAKWIRDKGLTVEWILETHAHADHLSAAPWLKTELGGEIGIGAHIVDVQKVFTDVFNAGDGFHTDGSQFDRLFQDGDTFRIGNVDARVMHTPGHTPACITYVAGDAAFVGDTIFMPDYGSARCDFPDGDARALYRSVRRLFELPDETRLFLCHDYKAPGRDRFSWETTVGDEKRHNIHVREGISEDEFVEMRTTRDKTLQMPLLMIPSVQVNMRAGHLPAPEDNGVTYLKVPVDQL